MPGVDRMDRNSALHLLDLPKKLDLVESLRCLPPERTFAIVEEIRRAEMEAFNRTFVEQLVTTVRPALTLVPAIARFDLDDFARRYAEYQVMREVELITLAIYGHDEAVLRRLVSLDGEEHMTRLNERGTPAVACPIHSGPAEAGIAIFSGLRPITIPVGERWPDATELTEAMFPRADAEVVRIGSKALFIRLIRALRRGRLVTMFPEFAFGVEQQHVRVPFMGTSVIAPTGSARLAQLNRGVVVPAAFARDDTAHWRFVVHEPIAVPRGAEARNRALADLFSCVESTVLGGRPWEWECWVVMEEMTQSNNESNGRSSHDREQPDEGLAKLGGGARQAL